MWLQLFASGEPPSTMSKATNRYLLHKNKIDSHKFKQLAQEEPITKQTWEPHNFALSNAYFG